VIVFLDFDGVLHPFHRPTGTLVLVPHFERVMADFPHVDIVISSAWREAYGLRELQSFFSRGIAKRIVDVTPVLSPMHHEYVRETEIETWLQEAGRKLESWIAIDDTEPFFSPECGNLILVDPNLGFNEKTEREVRERLVRGK